MSNLKLIQDEFRKLFNKFNESQYPADMSKLELLIEGGSRYFIHDIKTISDDINLNDNLIDIVLDYKIYFGDSIEIVFRNLLLKRKKT